jgi:hypothetical protein
MADEYTELDTACPGCGEHPVQMVWRPMRAVGSEEVVTWDARGADCPGCGLLFVNDDVREAAENGRPADV